MRSTLIATVCALAVGSAASGQAPLVPVRTIDLPAVEGRIDHLSVDVAANRLFVAALGNNSLEVIDLARGQLAKHLPGFHEPQGVQLVPPQKAVVVANGQSGDVQVVDSGELRPVKAIPVGEDADNVRYDEVAKRVYVGYGSGALAAIDPTDWRVLGTVRLSGHPESFQLERTGTRIFVNVPAAHQVAVVDRQAMRLLTTWPVVDAAANFPMALDEADHRLFIGCRRPAKVLVYDTAAGKAVGSFDTVGDTDDVFYDAARHRLYVSGGAGFLDVFAQQNDRFTRVARLPTASGARTSLYVPQHNRLYLAVPHRAAQKAEIRVYEAR